MHAEAPGSCCRIRAPGGRRALRMELHAAEIAPPRARRCTAAAVVAPWRACRGPTRRRVAVHEIDVVARRPKPASSGSVRSAVQRVPAHVRHRQVAGRREARAPRRRRRRGMRCRPPRSGDRAAACRGRCRAPAACSSRIAASSPWPRSRAIASPAAPTPGQEHARRPHGSPPGRGSRSSSRRGARARSASEARFAPPLSMIATSAAHSTPFVLGSSLPSRRNAGAARARRP